jgi:hypothetical protein
VNAELKTSLPREARSGLEAWRRGELPMPPSTEGFKLFKVVGPGVIVLGTSIGSGEWLIGPSTLVRYGLALLWVTTVAVFLQTVFNTEVVRYTLYTGESAFTGFMRTKPGSTFWAWVYSILYFLQNGWPGWAGASAAAVFFLIAGRAAGAGDARMVYAIGLGVFAVCFGLLAFGGQRIEKMLELLNWIMVTAILGALLVFCLMFAPPRQFLGAGLGFFGFDLAAGRFLFLPEGADWFLLGAFAAFSGCGGVTNIALSSWARDKGYGMGQVTGYIPTLVAGHTVKLAHTGVTFEPGPESLPRWRGWWRIVRIDQWGIFFVGALAGMALPGILYTTAIPAGTDMRGLNVSSELARGLASRGGSWIPLAVAIMSVWILFKAQVDIMEGMVRSITDILWSGSGRIRAWRTGDVRVVYYSVLVVVLVWGLIAMGMTQPIILLQVSANVAGLAFVFGSLHILRVNTTLLPKPLRPALWRRVALVFMAVFYGFFVYLWLMGGLVPNPARGFLFMLLRQLGLI